MTSLLCRPGPWPSPQAHLMPLSCHLYVLKGTSGHSLKLSSIHTLVPLHRGLPIVCGVQACSVAQSCPTLFNPVDHSLPVSSVHGIFSARILEWVAISFSARSCQPRDGLQVSCIGRRILYHWETWEASLSEVVMSIVHGKRILALMTWLYFQLRVT